MRPTDDDEEPDTMVFPRLRAGTFIEALEVEVTCTSELAFPRLRAGTFIEASHYEGNKHHGTEISPPSGGDFH